jgi:hypothetical protein
MTERRPARTIAARVLWLGAAPGPGFETTAFAELDLTYAGIVGDLHAGLTRNSGAREPWYPRGTPMRNERQLSLLSEPELTAIAVALDLPALLPAWIGGNLVLGGVPDFSLLPPRTLLLFPSGAAVRIDGDNAPCRQSGRAVAAHAGAPDLQFAFVKAARHKRGLVGWVEREGPVRVGDEVQIRVPEQSLYDP